MLTSSAASSEVSCLTTAPGDRLQSSLGAVERSPPAAAAVAAVVDRIAAIAPTRNSTERDPGVSERSICSCWDTGVERHLSRRVIGPHGGRDQLIEAAKVFRLYATKRGERPRSLAVR